MSRAETIKNLTATVAQAVAVASREHAVLKNMEQLVREARQASHKRYSIYRWALGDLQKGNIKRGAERLRELKYIKKFKFT